MCRRWTERCEIEEEEEGGGAGGKGGEGGSEAAARLCAQCRAPPLVCPRVVPLSLRTHFLSALTKHSRTHARTHARSHSPPRASSLQLRRRPLRQQHAESSLARHPLARVLVVGRETRRMRRDRRLATLRTLFPKRVPVLLVLFALHEVHNECARSRTRGGSARGVGGCGGRGGRDRRVPNAAGTRGRRGSRASGRAVGAPTCRT